MKLANCTNCLLCKTRKNVVRGIGGIKSKIIIIGDAPGTMEDAYGTPFIGDTGKQLDRMLRMAKLNRGECYLTNIVGCIPVAPPPKGFREPTKIEIAACCGYLEEELKKCTEGRELFPTLYPR